jgi:hypothetical protein
VEHFVDERPDHLRRVLLPDPLQLVGAQTNYPAARSGEGHDAGDACPVAGVVNEHNQRKVALHIDAERVESISERTPFSIGELGQNAPAAGAREQPPRPVEGVASHPVRDRIGNFYPPSLASRDGRRLAVLLIAGSRVQGECQNHYGEYTSRNE